MKVPIAWLRDYLDVTLTSDEIAERFASLGFPCDAIERRPNLSGIVVGRLAKVVKHPNADTLSLCTIDIGGPQTLSISTAATNVAEGDVVPVATVGAELKGGFKIGLRKMRGIDSQGMLCSADELGLEGTWFEDGILQLEKDLPLGIDFAEHFRLRDDVLDIEVTANRVDCLSVVGLARELGASLGTALREPQLLHVEGAPSFTAVTIESADCKRFVAQRFSGVEATTSPFWMRLRLALAGQRPIDRLVDISNFVMLETAQPLHFYDFDAMAGARVIVRDARPGERMRTLGKSDEGEPEERTLDPRFLVIADADDPQCIAGLKGAAASEVRATTREVLLEAATFSGPRIRRMSVALGLRTEASSRHEKGLPLGLSTWGAARAAFLLAETGATVHPPYAAGAADEAAPEVEMPVARISALLGIPVDEPRARGALETLGCTVATTYAADGDAVTLRVRPPFWRADIKIAEDVIEEVGRVVGYDKLVEALPPVLGHNVSSAAYRDERRVAHALAALGYREAITMSLQSAVHQRTYQRAGVAMLAPVLEITNPLSEDQRYLRFSLLPALLELAAQYARDEPYRVFEIGHTFADSAEGGEPSETAGVAWLLALPPVADEPAWRDSGFLQFKGESLALGRALTGSEPATVSATLAGWHPGKTASLLAGGKDLATVGSVDPRLAAAYDVRGRVYAGWMRLSDLPAFAVPRYAALSKYPPISRDLALVVAPELSALDVEHVVRGAAPELVASARVFDEYRGAQVEAGKKSLALRIVLQRTDATLTDADADAAIGKIVAALRDRCDAKIRT